MANGETSFAIAVEGRRRPDIWCIVRGRPPGDQRRNSLRQGLKCAGTKAMAKILGVRQVAYNSCSALHF